MVEETLDEHTRIFETRAPYAGRFGDECWNALRKMYLLMILMNRIIKLDAELKRFMARISNLNFRSCNILLKLGA